MVTIEQKLLLFSKLLNQSMNKKFEEDLKEIENQFNLKIQKYKEEVDKEVNEIEKRGIRKAEAKRNESLSKSKTVIKKEINELKEKYYNIFMDNFKKILQDFVQSREYKIYLSNIISDLYKEIKYYEEFELIVFLTDKDNDIYGDFITQELMKNQGFKNISLNIKEDILGGLIAEVPEKNFKIDMTIDVVLEDNKSYIMQTLFDALEAGGYND